MSGSLETRLFRANWGDGSLDLVAGCAVLLIGLGYLAEQMLVPAVVVPLALVAWLLLRKRVVEPRAGYVEFARRRRDRSSRELAAAAAVGIGLLILLLAVIVGARGAVPRLTDAVAALPALLVALAALAAAGLTRSWRFAVYAAVLVVAAATTVLLDTGPAMPLLAGGAVVGGSGAVLLARFVAESRRFEEEA